MRMRGHIDETNEQELHAKATYDKYQAILDEVNEKENLHLTHKDIHLARLQKLSVKKQKELGIYNILNDETIFTDEFNPDHYDTVFNALRPYDDTCTSEYRTVFDDLIGTLEVMQDEICGAITFGIGMTITFFVAKWGEEIGIALGIGRVGVYTSSVSGYELITLGAVDLYLTMGYTFDWNDIAGDSQYKAGSLGVAGTSFGISFTYDTNWNWISIEGAMSIVTAGIGTPITYEKGDGHTMLTEYDWLDAITPQEANTLLGIENDQYNRLYIILVGVIISLILVGLIKKCEKTKIEKIKFDKNKNDINYQTMDQAPPLQPL